MLIFLNRVMKAHFIGNGKSNRLFNTPYGIVVCGNIPNHSIPYTALSIIDTKVILYLKNTKQHLENIDVWCSPDIKKHADIHQVKGRWHTIYTPTWRYNSGHQAVNHLSKNPHLKIIELWGMDSMWSDDLISQMDDRVIRSKRPPLNNEWRPNWKKIFAQHPNMMYVINAPKGIEQVDYGKNTRYKLH